MTNLNRVLILPEVIIYGIGSMVGAGIYSIIGTAALKAGNHLWISFALTSIAAGITVLSYAELSSMFPRAGAEYQFIKHAFSNFPYLSFMAGFLIALNAAATSATVSIAFGDYLNYFINNPSNWTAFALLSLCTLINIWGIKQSTWVNIILVMIEVSGLLIIIWFGFTYGTLSKPFINLNKIEFSNIISASALIFFIFIGFEDIANLSEETKTPTKTIPRGLIYSVIITSIIYILVAFSFIALSNQDMFNSSSPLSTSIRNISPICGNFVAIAALFATTSTALITLVSISRMLFGMGREGAMPKIFSYLSKHRQTPWVAAFFLFLWACLLLLFKKIPTTASVASMGVLLVFMSIQIATISLRFSHNNVNRGFKIPFSIYNVPIIPVLGIMIITLLLLNFTLTIYITVGITIAIGSVIYLILKKKTQF